MDEKRDINPLKWLLQRQSADDLLSTIDRLNIPFSLTRIAATDITCELRPRAGFKCRSTGKTSKHALANALAVYLTAEERDYHDVQSSNFELGTQRKVSNKRTRRFERRHPEGKDPSNARSFTIKKLREMEKSYPNAVSEFMLMNNLIAEGLTQQTIQSALDFLVNKGIITIDQNHIVKEHERGL